MADAVGQWQDVPNTSAAGQWEDIPNPSAGPPKSFTDHLGDFAGHTWDALTGTVTGTAKAVMHPIDTASAILRDAADEIGKGKQAYEKGDYDRAAEHFKYALPVAGPLLRQMRQETDAGDYGSALGDITGTVLGGKLLARVPDVPGAAKAISKIPGKAVEFARTPGNLDLITGASQVAGGTASAVHGAVTLNPYTGLGGAAAVTRGLENIGKGIEKRGAAAAESAPKVAPAPVDPILDQIAQSTAGKKFSQLDPPAQVTVQKIADAAKAKTSPPETPPAAPPANPAPTPPPPAAPAAPAAITPEVTQLPATENPGAEVFKAKARAARNANVGPVADLLEKAGFTADLAKKLPPKGWLQVSKAEDGLGISIPEKLRKAVIDELDSRAAARDLAKTQQGTQAAADAGAKADATRRDTMIAPSEAYAQALQRPGALAAAKALADELAGDTPETLAQARARRTKAFDAAKVKR